MGSSRKPSFPVHSGTCLFSAKHISLGDLDWTTQCPATPFSDLLGTQPDFLKILNEKPDRLPLIPGFLPVSKSARKTQQLTLKWSLIIVSNGCASHILPHSFNRVTRAQPCARCLESSQRHTLEDLSEGETAGRNSADWFPGNGFPLSKYCVCCHGSGPRSSRHLMPPLCREWASFIFAEPFLNC